MITSITPYSDTRNRALPGAGFDGVVKISVGSHYGSGVLLFGGHAILTAAHLFSTTGTTVSETAQILFETNSGSKTIASENVIIHPSHDGDSNHDLAIIWLSESAPVDAERYDLYRTDDETGQPMTLVGYGKQGTGATGKIDSTTAARSKAFNLVDGLMDTVYHFQGSSFNSGSGMSWRPTADSQLVADFDDGTSAHDALGLLMDAPNLGLGETEGLIAPGDSGGPAFINGSIAGIASYTATLSRNSTSADIDTTSNSSFGEIAAWQRVSYYQDWIDQSLREALPNPPSTPESVSKEVTEGDTGTDYAYFLLKLASLRPSESDTFSVNFTTRNGTATAGEDYIAASGTLNIYPDENQVVIPVEIIGDSSVETDETFYLDITNPYGGGFGRGIVTLTAVRTILNDDH